MLLCGEIPLIELVWNVKTKAQNLFTHHWIYAKWTQHKSNSWWSLATATNRVRILWNRNIEMWISIWKMVKNVWHFHQKLLSGLNKLKWITHFEIQFRNWMCCIDFVKHVAEMYWGFQFELKEKWYFQHLVWYRISHFYSSKCQSFQFNKNRTKMREWIRGNK